MTRMLTLLVLMALASGCADTPLVPTPAAAAPHGTDRPLTQTGTFEMVLSNDDPPLPIGEIPYYFDPPYPRACAPCGVVDLGEPARTIVLTWTGDFTLFAWVEGEMPDGVTRVVAEYSVGAS